MILSQTARAIAAIFFLIRMQSSVESILVPPKKSHRSGAGERAIKRVIRVIPGSLVQAGGRNAGHEDEKKREEDFSECTEEAEMEFCPVHQ
jgi:hypothetical protein